MREVLDNLDAKWDVAVFDEAHHLTAKRESDGSTERTQRYRVGQSRLGQLGGLALTYWNATQG